MAVPVYPVAVIDVSTASVVVTMRAVSEVVGSHEEAVWRVALVAAELGRPVRVWLRRPGGQVEVAAVDAAGAYVDAEVGVPAVSGSPVPAEPVQVVSDGPVMGRDSIGITGSAGGSGGRDSNGITGLGGASELAAIAAGAGPVKRSWWPRRRPVQAGEDPLRLVPSMTWMTANKRGGAGKTSVAVVVAAACASVRPRDVTLVDINPVGNLALRAGTPSGARTVTEVAQWLSGLGRVPYEAELFDGAGLQEPGGWRAIPSRTSVVVTDEARAATLAAPLDSEQLKHVMTALSMTTRVVGIDAGNDHGTGAWLTAASLTDVLLVPVKLTPDTCLAAGEMLADLQKLGHGDLVTRRTLIVATRSPADHVDARQARSFREYFQRQGYQVLDLPADPELASKTAAISWDRLRPGTREAGLAIARAAARIRLGQV